MKIIYVTNNRQQNDQFKDYIDRLGLDIFLLSRNQDDLVDEKTIEMLSQLFSVIIFDETIPNNFLCELLPLIQPRFRRIMKITIGIISEENRRLWKERGIHFCLDCNTDMEDFREAVFQLEEKKLQEKNVHKLNEMFYNIKIFNFTNKERYIYKYLLENHHQVVRREKLCMELFDNVTLSTLAALSTCINSIRTKMEACGFESTVIKTVWGKGYQIDSNSYKHFK